MRTGEAARIIGKSARQIERWVDSEVLRGGRLNIKRSHRWVDAEHVVAFAVDAGRGHLVPEKWRHLIRAGAIPAQPSGGDTP